MEDPLVEARELAFLLVRAAERAKDDFGHAISGFGVSVPVARALLTLDSPAPMRALADQMSCDQSYVTSLADDLEAQGLATREPGQDRRVKVLTLTPKGIALRAELSAAVARTSAVMIELNAAQRDELRSLLVTLVSP
jgi:DNA-binding MarR family transcriptional regulator